jgi:hypothetical protein
VTGGGRTGSHWVEQIVSFVTEYQTKDLAWIGNLSTPGVFHAHDTQSLVNVPESVKRSCCLIFSKRRDVFAQAISLAVARYTDEWFSFTDKSFEPFVIDEQEFLTLTDLCQEHSTQFELLVRPIYAHVVDIDFEDLLLNQNRVEHFVAGKIGHAAPTHSKSWDRNRNPRDYRRLVKNWHALYDLYQNHKVSAH